ncbi:MAG: aromatic-ring-hydroxylating dioxygenase subunit beta [Rhodospirillales bacterium]|nr:aromatic-ring-hydroxylating dioxygenase subunit beta [Rhodospirillales bacterium]
MPNDTKAPALPDTTLLAWIDDLNRRYGHLIDDGDFEGWPSLFAEDGLYKITTRWNHERNMPTGLMLCYSRAMMEDRISALRTANVYEPHSYRHLIDPPLVISDVDGMISVQTSFVAFRTMQSGASEVFCAGKYLDKIIKTATGLEFSERIVVCDSESIDTLIVIPL